MSNTNKQWAFIALAFIAGFGASHYGNSGSQQCNNSVHESADKGGKRAQWAKAVKGRMQQTRNGNNRNRNEGRGSRRGKGEDHPQK